MAQNTLTGIGECMIELSSQGDDLLRKSFAGDVFNSLYYARKALGTDWTVGFYSGLGTDAQSDEMLSFLNNANIETNHILRVPERSPGLYMIHLDGAERSFSYWRDTSAARLLASDQARLRKVIQSANAIYLSGITLAILPDDDVAFLISQLRDAREAGKTVAFDPNIRPKLWSSPEHLKSTITKAGEASSIILPSFDDEVAAFGDVTPQDTINRYQSGNQLVVVKNGSGGVLASKDEETIQLPTEPVETPVDTTGAGDSFNGAFLASYLQTNDVETSIKAGQSCAAHVICHHGAII